MTRDTLHCEFCGLHFEDVDQYEIHMGGAHPEIVKIQCKICKAETDDSLYGYCPECYEKVNKVT